MRRYVSLNLRRARDKANLTQKEASERSGYSVRQIQRFESEGTGDLDVIEVFAKVYDIHSAKLIYPQCKWREVALELISPKVLDYFRRS